MKKGSCDGCHKERSDLRSFVRNGEPDEGAFCFLCRKEVDRGKVFSVKEGRYVFRVDLMELMFPG